MLRTLIMLVYSWIVTRTIWFLRSTCRIWPAKWRMQLQDRPSAAQLSTRVARERSRYPHSALFFCSSAGEFEQAKPLLDRLEKRGDVYLLTLFFSRSGLTFARSRGESSEGRPQRLELTPLTDSVWEWGSVLAASRPSLVAVVRHELWPGFLETARHYAPLYLIDASRSLGEGRSWLKRLLRGHLLRSFQRIFAVSPDDGAFFRETYDLADQMVHPVGDTKYDRVMERQKEGRERILVLDEILNRAEPAPLRLVVGSAHLPDVALVVEAYGHLGTQAKDWQVLLVPHHVTEEHLEAIESKLAARQLSVCRFSHLKDKKYNSNNMLQFILVDTMGLLADLYGTGQAALVGGAMHHQIHNVLEPACHGLALAWGPFYKNSHEAVHLVQQGLACVVHDASALATWWGSLQETMAAKREALAQAVAQRCGASETIMSEWEPLLHSANEM